MAANGSKTEGGHVVVACKTPAGYHLRAFVKKRVNEPIQGGGYREIDVWVEAPGHRRHTVFGPAAPEGGQPCVPVVGGYAINEGVPADLWESWLKDNVQHPAVVNGLIAGFPNRASAEAFARNGASLRSGLESMAPEVYDRDGRVVETDPRTATIGKQFKVQQYTQAA